VFARLGGWCHRRRRIVVVAWLLVLLAGGGVLGAVGTESHADLTLPAVESAHGLDVLKARFGGQSAGQAGSIVMTIDTAADPAGFADPAVAQPLARFVEQVGTVPGVSGVASPFGPGGGAQISTRPGHEGAVAYATVDLDPNLSIEDAASTADAIRALEPHLDGVDLYLGGQIFSDFEAPSSELLGLSFAIVVLVLSFGSVLAMGLPIGVALAGIGVGSVAVGLLSHVATVPDFATTLGVMIGLGVGIDYALFIVTRFREQLHAGHDVGESVTIAIDTAGRAVSFAGITVVISLLGMLLMGVSFVSGLAVGAATVVLVTMIASLTLLPALLGFAGPRIEVTRWRGLLSAGLVALALLGLGLKVQPLIVGLPLAVVVILASLAVAPLRRPVQRRPPKPLPQTTAFRWSRFVQRNPWPAVVAGGAILVVLALPVFGLHLGSADEGNAPAGSDTRIAYDLLADGFGPGFNGPLVLVTELPAGAPASALDRIGRAVAATPGVDEVSPVRTNDPADPTAAMWQVVPTTSPQDAGTTALVHRLRDEVLPGASAGTGIHVDVTGTTAVQVDFAAYLGARLPLFFGAVLGLSFLLLMVVFRSILVPLKAVVMNLLSIGAAFGVVVAVFQWGWGSSLLNLGGAPVESFLPMMLFAIVFGLSMDYEVFLLSRVKEEWDHTHDASESVANGLAATARVITAAAAIMVVVFGSFLLESNRTIKLFGSGLAIAVLIDATVVRMLLVPATMELLGARNWWLPRWLDRLLPTIQIEGGPDADVDGVDDPDDLRTPELVP
jgi:RND superfamily putative drug exporter